MLTQTQCNTIFQAISVSYTVSGTLFTALKTYRAHWRGELAVPVICLEYGDDGVKHISSVGRKAQYDKSELSVDVYATSSGAIHGSTISREIAATVKALFDSTDAFNATGVSVMHTTRAIPLDDLEDGIYRIRFTVVLLHKAI